MPEILRVKINWTGFVGAPGYTNLYFSEFVSEGYTQAHADGAVAKAVSFVNGIKTYLPNVVTIGVDPTVEIVQADTGQLVGFFTTAPAAPSAGTASGTYSAASGVCFSWGTNGVRNGRRVRGRTFVVPVAGAYYDLDGTINNTAATSLRATGAALLATGGVTDFGIWSRPSSKGATDGVWHAAETATLKDKVAVLRSRRD